MHKKNPFLSHNPSLLAHFRSFCYQNNPPSIEEAIDYFAVFGGSGWTIDFSLSIKALIEEKILQNYRYIHGDLTKITHSKPQYHAMLTAIASGDRREHAAFKKSQVGREEGEEIIDFLIKDGFLSFDKSVEKPFNEEDGHSDRLLFQLPYLRFWFAMVSPLYKSIKVAEYTEFFTNWESNRQAFSTLIYQQLTQELILDAYATEFEGDPIVSMGSYYDKYVQIDILAKRKSGKLLAGSCKISKAKAKKSEWTTLQEKCEQAKLEVDDYLIFSKNKFSSELKNLKENALQLFSSRHLKTLLTDLSSKDLLAYTNKKY